MRKITKIIVPLFGFLGLTPIIGCSKTNKENKKHSESVQIQIKNIIKKQEETKNFVIENQKTKKFSNAELINPEKINNLVKTERKAQAFWPWSWEEPKKKAPVKFYDFFLNPKNTTSLAISGAFSGLSLVLGSVGLGYVFEKVVPNTKYWFWSYSFPKKVEELLKTIFDCEISEDVKKAGSNLMLDLLRINDPELKTKFENFNNKLQNFLKNKTDAESIKTSLEANNFITEYFDGEENKTNNGFISLILQAIEKDTTGKTAKNFVMLVDSLKGINNKNISEATSENWHKFIFTDDAKKWYEIQLKVKIKETINIRKKRQISAKRQTINNTIFSAEDLQTEKDLTSFFDKLIQTTLYEGKEKEAINKYKQKLILLLDIIGKSFQLLSKNQKTDELKNCFSSLIAIILYSVNAISGVKAIDYITNPLSTNTNDLAKEISKFLTKDW
ncbi:hypothetical protein QLQ80_00960 [Mycoplasma sp. M5725]|uniref:Uncharacterized protein n=1 Tax=Mycoplasma phocimorsus TaxID=3045839 RepID=A0AAJ1PRT0_9MOLU|nr:hypothetical protein [Mycoplasma phocimorsus]MDJ1645661.1 hypothetical protein [Mycoplasma phocimorsus]